MFSVNSKTGDRELTGKGCMTIIIAVLIIVLLAGILFSIKTIKYGTVGLVVRFGRLTGRTLEPGIHITIPFIDRTIRVPTTIRSYETSDNPKESQADYRDYPVTAQTVDGQQISVKYTVVFRVEPDEATGIIQNVGDMDEVVENVVKAHSRNLSRLIAQSYTAEELYSGDGIFGYQDRVREMLSSDMGRYGVSLNDFLVRKIDFDVDYIAAIEQQQIAQETIETAQYQAEAAEYERDRQITLAEAEKERAILLAEAEAEKERLLADAEAYSIETRGKALRENPELVQWEFVRNLEGVTWGILPDNAITPLLPVPRGGD